MSQATTIKNEIMSKSVSVKRQHRKEYVAWRAMIRRCYNEKFFAHKYYGGRGITMCERWRTSFENFLDDMGESPTKWHSLDRIDTNGNYEPTNCRWATYIEQANNRRGNRIIEWNGKSKTLAQWANEFGINQATLYTRLADGWSIEQALTSPAKKLQKVGRDAEILNYYKDGLRIIEIVGITGINYQTVAWKIRKAKLSGQL